MKRIVSICALFACVFLPGAKSLRAQSLVVDKAALTFPGQFSGPPITQTLNITSTGDSIPFILVAPSGTTWLRVSGQSTVSGMTPGAGAVTADPVGLAPGVYKANLTVIGGATNLPAIPVTFTVSAIIVNPASVSVNYTVNDANLPAPQSITLSGAAAGCNAVATSISGGNWFTLLPTTCTVPGSLTFSFDAAVLQGLAPGRYAGSVTIAPVPANNTPAAMVSLSLVVISNPAVIIDPAAIGFNFQVGGSNNIVSQLLTISTAATQPLSFSIIPGVDSGSTWSGAMVTPSFGATDPSGKAVSTVGVLPDGLTPGTYTGTVAVFTPGGTPASTFIPLSLVVSTSPLLNVPPATLYFIHQLGGSPPPAQNVNITSTSTPLSYTNITSADTPWLVVPDSGTTPGSLTVSIKDPGTLALGTYTANITVIDNATGTSAREIPVVLKISNDPLITGSLTEVDFPYQIGQLAPIDQSTGGPQKVKIGSSSGVPLNFTATLVPGGCGNNWLQLDGGARLVAGITDGSLTVSVNAAGLKPTTCVGAISIAATNSATGGAAVNSPLIIPVTLFVSSGPLLVMTPAMPPVFRTGVGTPVLPPQNVNLTSTSADILNFDVTVQQNNGAGTWLFVTPPAGTTARNQTLTITAAPGSLPPGTYNGTVTVIATGSGGSPVANSGMTIPVTLTVTTGSLAVTGGTLVFEQAFDGVAPPCQTATVSSGGAMLNYTTTSSVANGVADGKGTANWLSVSPDSGNTSTSGLLIISVDGSRLTPGIYQGTVIVRSPGAANSPGVINVTFKVASASLAVTSTALAFGQTFGGPPPAPQKVILSSRGEALNYTAVANGTVANSNGIVNWLSVSPASGTTSTSAVVTISADGSRLTPGTYQGTIVFTSPRDGNNPTVINVTFKVNQGVLNAPTVTLSFAQSRGGTAPAGQTIAVGGSPGALNFIATARTEDGNTWLTLAAASGTTPANLQVLVSAGALPEGVYKGTVNIASGVGVVPIIVPVLLTVTAPPTLSGSPASLIFTYTGGETVPSAQDLAVSTAVTGTRFNVALQSTGPVQSAGPVPSAAPAGWLSVTPISGTAPANLSVSVDPTALPDGLYTGTITLTSSTPAASFTVPVSLRVGTSTNPLVDAIVNAADYSTGGISPGENVVIFGTGIGPDTLASGAVTDNAFTNVTGDTRVLFDGLAAPILYASATQTSVMVPYSISSGAGVNIVVEVAGVQSSAVTYFATAAAPAIYTLNQYGSGQGAILNQDGVSVNGPDTPEKRGNVITLYMTGEGQTDPHGIDGLIIPAVASALKRPVLPVTATIGGIPAEVVYAGSAPGLVSGVMQVNLVIPAAAPTGGAVPLVITVGTTATTQPGADPVTVAVR